MKRLNLVTKKIGMAMICASLLISGMSLTGCGDAETDNVEISESADATSANAGASEEETDKVSTATGEGTAYKEETVYVTTDLSGKTSTITVSDWLKNNDNYKTLTDTTTLSDVVNVKGDEAIEQNGDKLTIAADGSDIYYQGTVAETSKLPVDLQISYKLDGKTISAEDLQGKSGKVEITIKYKNNEKTTVDGEEVYVPFMAATGMVLDADNFSNIRVENGKVVSNGYYQAVIGYGLPGLNESLGLKGDDAIFTDEIVITADTTDYNVDTVMSFYSATAFSDIDFDEVSDLDDLQDSLNELSDASKELVDGTEELSDGAKDLYDGLVKISDGADTLASGTSSFDSNYKTFDSGLSQLDTALATLNTKMSSMYDQIDAAVAQYTELAASAPKLAAAYAANDAEATYGGDIQKAMYLSQTYGKPDYEELTQAYAAIEKYYGAYQQYAAAGDEASAQQAAAAATQYAVAYNTGCASYYESAAEQAKGAAAALQTIKDAMDKKDESTGLDTKGSLSALQSAGDKLASASSQLSSASTKIKNGAAELADGAATAKDGSSDLYDGSVELKEGMAKFDKEGIQKLVDAFDGDLGDVIDKLDSVVDAGKNYNTYTTLGNGQEGTVTFVVTSK